MKQIKSKSLKPTYLFWCLFVAPWYDRTMVIPNANSRVVLWLVGIGTKVWNFGWMLARSYNTKKLNVLDLILIKKICFSHQINSNALSYQIQNLKLSTILLSIFFVCSCIILSSSVHIWLVFMTNCISMGPTTHESK